MMRKTMLISTLTLALAAPGFAQMGGGGHGWGGGGGAGMASGMNGGAITVADDGSLLLTEGHGGMGWWQEGETTGALVNVGPDGSERWRFEADGLPPMWLATAGDLVIVRLVGSNPWDDQDGSGDSGWHGGMGGMSTSTLAAVDLVRGVELWRFEPEDPAMLRVEIGPDGDVVYVQATTTATMDPGSMHQGDWSGWGGAGTSTLYAFDRSGTELWSLELGG